MKKILFGTLCGLLAASPALGADMPLAVKAPLVASVPAFSWTGFYVGANVGFGGDRFEYPYYAFQRQLQAEAPALETRIDGSLRQNSSGFFGGGQIGYNYQFNNGMVTGLEADFQGAGIEGKLAGTGALTGNGNQPINANFSMGSEIEWFGTVRGRIGYAWDRVLLYATGGFAYGKVTSHANINLANGNGLVGPLTGAFSASNTHLGWTAGAGLEYALTRAWSFKTEYLYLDLGGKTVVSSAISDVANGFSAGAGIDVNATLHTVKAGVNYRF